MANYEELVDLVCESAEDDSKEFKELKKRIVISKKQLKLAVQSKNPNEIKDKINKLQKDIEDLKKFISDINPDDYGNEQDRQLKVMVSGICQMMSLAGVFTALSAYASYDKETTIFGTEVGIIGALWSFATDTNIKTFPEFKNKVESEIDKTQKCLDKIKAKCIKKNLLPDEKDDEVKESVNSIKLAIYESCHAGEITEEERDELLEML